MFVRSGIRENRAAVRLGLRLGVLLLALCALSLPGGGGKLGGTGTARAQGAAVDVFPSPGTHYNTPQTTIAFRGIPASQIGSIVVTGSKSGVHTGTFKPDSDGRGGSFIPSTPFTADETVTVQTSLNVVGGSNGTFQFAIATPAGLPGPYHWPAANRVSGDVHRFHSRPDLVPDTLKVTVPQKKGVAPGDIFVAPQYGPVQDGPMIFDPYGNLLWFKPLSGDDSASDFRVQTYQGQQVLTWWQGDVTAGIGLGEDVIYNDAYQQIAVVQGANGLQSDEHEFQLTPQGTALITAYYPVMMSATSVHGPSSQVVFDAVVQEIDIPTGNVLFQWDSLDHVPLSWSYSNVPPSSHQPYDYFHVNSIARDDDGNLLISGRNTWAAYKVSHQTGATIWELGGKHSSFKLAPGTYWAFQHDVRPRARGDQYITLFDDSAGPPTIHPESRGLKLELNLKSMTAKQVTAYLPSPSISTNFEGNVQQLPNFDDFVGYGQQPYMTEYSSSGKILFDARFVSGTPSYRAYRFQWSGNPWNTPAVAASPHGSTMTVYASWNGATHIRSWRVLAGSSATSLRSVKTVLKGGFETAITVGAQNYVEVEPLDWSGHVLSKSAVTKT